MALSYCGSSDWEVFHPNDDDLDCVTMTIQCVRATAKQWDEDESAEYNLAATRWNERKHCSTSQRWEKIAEIARNNIKENDEPNRVKFKDGFVIEGRAADEWMKFMRLIVRISEVVT